MVLPSILLGFLVSLLVSCSPPKPAAHAPTMPAAEAPTEPAPTEPVAVVTPQERLPGEAPPDVLAPPANAIKHDGIFYTILRPGDAGGVSPTVNDAAEVHYSGWTTDGKLFDSSVDRGKPATFELGKIIEGWRRALPLMKTGQHIRVWIPEELAYEGRDGAPKGMLVFEIELLKVHKGPEVPVDLTSPPDTAIKLESGLVYRVLQAGTGAEHPDPQDEVEVHYSGWTTDGQMFDSSVARGRAARFIVSKVIPGWTEALGLMVVGEKSRFWVPKELSERGLASDPTGPRVFDIELVSIENRPEPPAPPKNVARAPRRSKRTKSGLRYLRLTKGKPGPRPTAESRVEVHYTGWTTDGKMFDSSIVRGKPARFPLNAVIPGWTEALALMRVGDKTRFWIPKKLAYRGSPGKPAGMLVFDIELLSFEP